MDKLWSDLIDFLLATSVYRDSKSPALERLARERPELPTYARERLYSQMHDLLWGPAIEFISEPALVPYPPALRLAAVYGLADQSEIIAATASFAGSPEPTAREEAARTIAAIAKYQSSIWLLPLAVQLALDTEITVKAYAGTALAMLSRSAGTGIEMVATEQLDRLLTQDGALVPLVVMRNIAASGAIPPLIKGRIKQLSEAHPSSSVRREAVSLINTMPDTE
jgi:hypothetical protein